MTQPGDRDAAESPGKRGITRTGEPRPYEWLTYAYVAGGDNLMFPCS